MSYNNDVLLGKSHVRLTAYANNIASKRADNIVLIGNDRAKVPALAKHGLPLLRGRRRGVTKLFLSLISDTRHILNCEYISR